MGAGEWARNYGSNSGREGERAAERACEMIARPAGMMWPYLQLGD